MANIESLEKRQQRNNLIAAFQAIECGSIMYEALQHLNDAQLDGMVEMIGYILHRRGIDASKPLSEQTKK